jgi:hypothetical protein
MKMVKMKSYIKADTIVVKEIYLSEQEFEDGELANFYTAFM